MTNTQLFLFLLASLAVITTPGQDFLLVLSRGVAIGARAGVATAAGVATGLVGHTLLVTFGVGALLTTSAIAFTVIKFVGAAYLIYLGLKLLRSGVPELSVSAESQSSVLGCFCTGVVSNLANPKITIFYFAYIPQFLPDNSDSATGLFALGIVFALLTFLVKGPIGFLAGQSASWIKKNQTVFSWFNRATGALLIALGIKLALERKMI